MDNKKIRQALTDRGLTIGSVLVIDHREWKISELRDERIILYREGIDGGSRIKELTVSDLERVVRDQTL